MGEAFKNEERFMPNMNLCRYVQKTSQMRTEFSKGSDTDEHKKLNLNRVDENRISDCLSCSVELNVCALHDRPYTVCVCHQC